MRSPPPLLSITFLPIVISSRYHILVIFYVCDILLSSFARLYLSWLVSLIYYFKISSCLRFIGCQNLFCISSVNLLLTLQGLSLSTSQRFLFLVFSFDLTLQKEVMFFGIYKFAILTTCASTLSSEWMLFRGLPSGGHCLFYPMAWSHPFLHMIVDSFGSNLPFIHAYNHRLNQLFPI